MRVLLKAILPLVEATTATRFWSQYLKAQTFDFMSDRERDAERTAKLKYLLEHAMNSDFNSGRCPNPVLAGDSWQELVGQFTPVTKLQLRPHFPKGLVTSQNLEDLRYASTSGTNERMTVVVDFQKRDYLRSGELRGVKAATGLDVGVRYVEIPPDACNETCGLHDPAPPKLLQYFLYSLRRRELFTKETRIGFRGRIYNQVLQYRTTLPPLDSAPIEQLSDQVSNIVKESMSLRPQLLRAYPLYLLWISDWLKAADRSWDIPAIGPYGGLTSTAMKQRIVSGLAGRFVDLYGTSELGTIAVGCGESESMHIFEDNFVVEIFRDGKLCEPGDVGEIVVTDLTNTAMPLIRYVVGDLGRIVVGECPCGRRTERLDVLGRTSETLVSQDKWVSPKEIADVFFADPGILNARLNEIRPNVFEAKVVSSFGNAQPDLRGCEDHIASLYPNLKKIECNLVPFISPESSGKYRIVQPIADRVTPFIASV